MWEHALIPDGSCILHYLWALMFMKDYVKATTMSTLAGTNPKTFRKWVWRQISAITSLESIVVSNTVHILLNMMTLYLIFVIHFYFRSI